MRKFALAAFAGVSLAALAACSDTDPAMTEDETAMDDTALPAEETVAAPDNSPSSDSTRVSIDENGVNVDIDDGDTSVSADPGGGMSASFESE